MEPHFPAWHLLGNLKQNTKVETTMLYNSAQWLTMIDTSIALRSKETTQKNTFWLTASTSNKNCKPNWSLIGELENNY